MAQGSTTPATQLTTDAGKVVTGAVKGRRTVLDGADEAVLQELGRITDLLTEIRELLANL